MDELSNKVKGLITAGGCLVLLALLWTVGPKLIPGVGDGVFSATESLVVEAGLEKALEDQPAIAGFVAVQAADALDVIKVPGYKFGDVIKGFAEKVANDSKLTDTQKELTLKLFNRAHGWVLGFFDGLTDVTPEQKATVALKMATLVEKVASAVPGALDPVVVEPAIE